MANVKAYFQESYDELVHKVTWPGWKQLQSTAILVLVASVIIALLIFLMDYIFGVQVADTATTGFQWKGLLGFAYDLLKSF